MIKVSVIIPIYNVKNYIDRQVQSILAQTMPDWELILVDDGSTDNIKELLEKYICQDSRIKAFYHEKNQGAGPARATGLEHAVGECVCFFDADDWVEPETLEEVYDLMKQNDAQVVCYSRYEEYGNRTKLTLFENDGITKYTGTQALHQLHRRKNIKTSSWNKMYRRELLNKDMFAQVKLVGEDYQTMIALFEKVSLVVQTNKPYYHYCFRKGSALNTGYSDFYGNGFYSYKKYEAYLLEHYPQFAKDIKRYHLIEQMAIVVAMFKNDVYDDDIRREITGNVRKNLSLLIFCRDIELRFKLAALALSVHYGILRCGYRLIKGRNT